MSLPAYLLDTHALYWREFTPKRLTLSEASGYQLEPLTWDDIRQLPSFPEVPEMQDRLIAIAAKRLGAVVSTRDPFLHGCSQIRCLW
jgi:hypothetical protein